MARIVTNRPQQTQFSPALQYISEQHGSDSQRAEHQSESAKRLKGRQVRIFYAVESGKPLGCRNGFEAKIRQLLIQSTHCRGSGFGSHVQKEEAVAAPFRE